MIWFDYDWYDSNGCRIEAEVARGCGIKRYMLNDQSKICTEKTEG